MSDELGFDELTDDQLIEFARAMAEEIASRGAVVAEAAFDAVATDRAAREERQREAKTRAERAHAAQWSDWARATRVALMIEETLGPGWRFAAWRSPRGERRVYIDRDGSPRRVRPSDAIRAHHGKAPRPADVSGKDKVSFFVDGGSRTAPGYLELTGAAGVARRDRIEAIVRYIAASWDERGGVATGTVLAARVTPAPPPSYYS